MACNRGVFVVQYNPQIVFISNMLKQSVKTHVHKLHQKKYRYGFGEYIIEGVKGVEAVLASNKKAVFVIVQEELIKHKAMLALLQKVEDRFIPIHVCSEKDAHTIKTTKTFPGIMAVVKIDTQSIDAFDLEKPIICLDGVQDPGNLGTIIRTADWFGIHNILLSEDCVDVYNDKVVRSTMGSLFNSVIVKSTHIVSDIVSLKTIQGYEVVGLTLDGETDIQKQEKKAVYIFGSESHGIRSAFDPIIDSRYTIAGSGSAESLNVAIAAGIMLYSIRL